MKIGSLFDGTTATDNKTTKNPMLDEIIGCEIKTHYGTGGVVTSYYGPHEAYGPDSWTIHYEHNGRCWINSIKTDNGTITCEGVPLNVVRRVQSVQMSLF